ncbi:type II secretion system F family protein [Sphingorhabdus sp. SMR4y]|uniref:type II secretion system F family protein n=1 Tax=Sphingorhabdus sp. SMR4y TaxID=2584094 RepID=UPI000B5CA7A6|nr:type II secretion system F family protein [Sphingorhabdus sp. SMR4y]ASK88421.1 type II secretion system (T2SS), protein F [Sphingorhabdus sp. SMR4y]
MTPSIIRLFVLILIFASVFLAAEATISWMRSRSGSRRAVNKRLKMMESGLDREVVLSQLRRSTESNFDFLPLGLGNLARRFERILQSSGINMPVRNIVFFMLAGTGLIFAITLFGAAVAGYSISAGITQLAIVFSAVMGIGVPLVVFTRLSDRRRTKMQQQFPVALDVFVRGLRAGHPISAALSLLTTEMQDPIGSEFGIVVDEVNYGADLRDSLQSMADRWDMDDMQMFVVSLSVQSETGGNLAEILENLSGVIRERASMMMKVRALSSEGRMTALILTALPILSFAGLFLVKPSFYLDIATDPAFIIGFSGLVLLYFIGFFTIRRMIDLKV